MLMETLPVSIRWRNQIALFVGVWDWGRGVFVGAAVAEAIACEELDDIRIFGAHGGEQILVELHVALHALCVGVLTDSEAADVADFLCAYAQLANQEHQYCQGEQ